jgi:hypothetical protein
MGLHLRTLACHNIEAYEDKLRAVPHRAEMGGPLRMHCYRAVLESLLRAREAKLGLPPSEYTVRAIKRADRMPFPEYLEAASARLGLELSDSATHSQVGTMLGRWLQCSTFYVLRLLMAPVYESFLLLDRVCFLQESGKCSTVGLHAAFDPVLSPRNLVITARKVGHLSGGSSGNIS